MILLARLYEGPNNGMAYAVAPVEDRYRVLPTRDPLADAAALSQKGERVLVLYSLSTPVFIEQWREIAEVASRYPVVAGGPHAVGDPLTLLKLGVKYVVVGDGEAALPAIVEREAEGGEEPPPNTITAVDGRPRAGRRVYVELVHRTYSRSLEVYPPIEIMRSCVYRCAFCQTWAQGRVRFRPLENVVELAKAYVAAGHRAIRFIAPVGFLYGSPDGRTPSPDALAALLKAVREVGGVPHLGTFPSETRPETVTRDVLKAVKPYVANRRISFGLQTASDKLLKLTKRDHDVAAVEEAVKTAVSMGFKPVVDVIGGLPGEEEDDVVKTVREMEKLVAMGANIRMHYYIPLPGTPLWGRRPAPPHPLYEQFIKRHRRKVEGYWREQIELSRRIVETYRELDVYLRARTTPSSTAS
ncbi:TIGR04013 family B12-binding domain/radical SAM domain-containing protein [Pyrobaculum neutrophilum]|uniref:Radical SAM domain protein n=1 Tax=Pyrobaculum neutrophilum (strain DSM 2338 / JCM 9278 / NBRC 100436 / V24Sta) TaxID=444157 RepID=B1Y8Q1_PYRNV|nr:TIGR04013 family B12-binding domain/radical SAM domain-containing protein [Pyrobaculum neutrophilum]ACB40130.1 Radical SAM domain protein [Pyrobaculum neutrophilum V24Sta]